MWCLEGMSSEIAVSLSGIGVGDGALVRDIVGGHGGGKDWC